MGESSVEKPLPTLTYEELKSAFSGSSMNPLSHRSKELMNAVEYGGLRIFRGRTLDSNYVVYEDGTLSKVESDEGQMTIADSMLRAYDNMIKQDPEVYKYVVNRRNPDFSVKDFIPDIPRKTVSTNKIGADSSVIATSDGYYDIGDLKRRLTKTEVTDRLIPTTISRIPSDLDIETEHPEAIEFFNSWEPEVMELVAMMCVRPMKSLSTLIIVGPTNSGKSSLFDVVRDSLGFVRSGNVIGFRKHAQDGFSYLADAITKSRLVLIDEASDGVVCDLSGFKQMTGTYELDYQLKNSYESGVPRVGNIVMIGNDAPALEVKEPAVADRIVGVLYDNNSGIPVEDRLDRRVFSDPQFLSTFARRFLELMSRVSELSEEQMKTLADRHFREDTLKILAMCNQRAEKTIRNTGNSQSVRESRAQELSDIDVSSLGFLNLDRPRENVLSFDDSDAQE